MHPVQPRQRIEGSQRIHVLMRAIQVGLCASQRTGAELKAAFLAAVQRREREQVSSGGWLCPRCRLRQAPSLREGKGWGREAACWPQSDAPSLWGPLQVLVVLKKIIKSMCTSSRLCPPAAQVLTTRAGILLLLLLLLLVRAEAPELTQQQQQPTQQQQQEAKKFFATIDSNRWGRLV